MRFIQHMAMATLISFVPIAVGCSSSSSPSDEQTQPAADGPKLSVVGASGEQPPRPFTKDEVDSVVNNTASFEVDGVQTTDFSKVLTAQKVVIDAGGGKTATLLRNGNRLELQGSSANIAVEIDGTKFTIVSDAGRWDCILSGMTADQQGKVAGAMTLATLLALDADIAASAQQGQCEVACIAVLSFAILVGIGILAATTAYIVCETTGQDHCNKLAATTCKNGASKVEKVCDFFSAFEGVFKNGKIEFQGGCKITCK